MSRGIRFWMWCLIVAHALALIVIACLIQAPNSTISRAIGISFSVGFTLGQASLAGFCVAFASLAIRSRIIIAFLTIGLSSLCFDSFVVRTNGPFAVSVIAPVTIFSQTLVCAFIFRIMHRVGWRLTRENAVYVSDRKAQFHLRHLFVWVTVTAILFASGRILLPVIRKSLESNTVDFAAFFCIALVGHALIAGPVCWATLSQNRTIGWATVAAFVICATMYLEYTCLEATQFGKYLKIGHYVISMTTTFVATLLPVLFVVRMHDWHLSQADHKGYSLN